MFKSYCKVYDIRIPCKFLMKVIFCKISIIYFMTTYDVTESDNENKGFSKRKINAKFEKLVKFCAEKWYYFFSYDTLSPRYYALKVDFVTS